jgi:hypothetical protein
MTKVQEINTQTQEITKRDANAIELEILENQKTNDAKEAAELQAKATAKGAALAKLAALGFTLEDLHALGL